MLTKVKPDHHAVEAARKELYSSVIAKYQKFIGREALRLSRPGNEDEVAEAPIRDWITKSQARAFQGTPYVDTNDIEQIRSELAYDIADVLARIRVA